MRAIIFLALGVLCALSFACCRKKEDPCASYDANKPYASIKKAWAENQRIEVDTILTNVGPGSGVVFSTTQPYDSYTWRIGTDARTWKTPNVYLTFDEGSGNLNITMIGKRKPNPCDPKDTGIDTLRSKLFLKVWNFRTPPEPYLFEGTWHGYFTDEPNKPFDVYIKYWTETPTFDDWDGLRVHNLPPGCGCKNGVPDNIVYSLDVRQLTYKAFTLQGDGNSDEGCYGMRGLAYLDKDNNDKITIETSIFKKVFVGTRKK